MKKMSFRIKIIALAALFMLSTNLALGTMLVQQSRRAMKTLIDERMLDVASSAASMLDGDVLDRLTAEDWDTPEYREVLDTLTRFRDNIKLKDIYYVRANGDGTFSFGIDSDPVAPGQFGSPVEYTDALFRASQGEPAVDKEPYLDAWGRFYSAYSPVFNSAGRVAGVVVVDFEASWYESQLNNNAVTVLAFCALSLLAGIVLVLFTTRHYTNSMEQINLSLDDLANDMYTLTGDTSPRPEHFNDWREDSILRMSGKIARLRDELREHLTHMNTRANSMITAMASDYRCVYYVNLDENEGVCYRGDPDDDEQTAEGIPFPYMERFRWYAEHSIAESYREGFLHFIHPENIRNALAKNSLIAYRYLATRKGMEYYEMVRVAGVRRMEERDDHIVHAIGMGFSIIDTEMRETLARNEALAEALAVAEEASQAKTAFLSSMSHEIRTPMNAIIGLDTLALHDESLSEQTREYLVKIGGSARHLLELINDILDMSRIESGRIVLRREEFSFAEMLEQINTMVMSQCSDKGLRYEYQMRNRVSDYYIGDDTKLKEVLLNILSNAIKFTDAPGSVTLSVECTAQFEGQSTLKFRVKDTGIGMDKEYIPRIFEPFSQEDSSRKNKFGSTGLGMAITKRIVEMMNGSIGVESEKGVGTQFTVQVTLKNSDRKGIVPENAVDVNRIRVLVVDEDPIAAEHARMELDEAGIRTDVCGAGQDPVQLLDLQHGKQEPYNLVLLDQAVNGGDGLGMARRIREHYSGESLVILLTAFGRDEVSDQTAQSAGVDGFLTKPLFASAVSAEFERVARRNNLRIFREKRRVDLAGRRILLAEDVEINAEIMMDVLEMKDAEADHAENGREAVELFEKSAVDSYAAILMDIRMPEMDGLEAAAAIRALDRPDAQRIPIIALTANAFDEDVQRSLQAGMNAHLSKPVEPEHLYQTLEKLIYEAEQANE